MNSLVLEAIANWLELAGPARDLGWLEGNASFLEQGASVQADYVNCLEVEVPVETYCQLMVKDGGRTMFVFGRDELLSGDDPRHLLDYIPGLLDGRRNSWLKPQEG